MNDELKPCPFCGGEARHNDGGNSTYGRLWWCVWCENCQFEMRDLEVWSADSCGMLDPAYQPKECFTRWNARAPQAQEQEPAKMTIEKIVTVQRGRGTWQGPESEAPRAMGARHVGDLISREAAAAEAERRVKDWLEAEPPYTSTLDDAIALIEGLPAAIRSIPAQTAAPARCAPDLSALERYGEVIDYDMNDDPCYKIGADNNGEYVRLDAVCALMSSHPAPAVDLVKSGVTTSMSDGPLTAFDKLAAWAGDGDAQNVLGFDAEDAGQIVDHLRRLSALE